MRLCRRLATTRQCRYDLGTLARFVLHGTENTNRHIAREYYFPRNSRAYRETANADP